MDNDVLNFTYFSKIYFEDIFINSYLYFYRDKRLVFWTGFFWIRLFLSRYYKFENIGNQIGEIKTY